MKLKNKLILIFILFAGFVMFNSSDCFAASYSYLDIENTKYFEQVKGYINASLDDYYNSFYCVCHEMNNGNTKFLYCCYLYNSSDSFMCRSMHSSLTDSFLIFNCSNEHHNKFGTFKLLSWQYNTGNETVPYYQSYDTVTSYQSKISPYSNGYYLTYYSSSMTEAGNTNYFYCNTNVYSSNSTLREVYYSSFSDVTLVYEPEPETTKHDIFQLNLTDKNFNNSQHTFILNTDENSVNYSEINDLIENNNKYCIYVTDYTRLLTFSDNSFNATLQSSSYLLSGYIDFLVSDNAYFYFSPHYNRIKVCSGDYRGQDMSTYTKRYFFNLVYSDDSDDTYFTILDDNGLLWSLSDYVNDGITSSSDYLTDIKNSYFIGSNQVIYYANEDSNYILDSLTNSIYYGKDRGADERIYNFCFSGGNKKEFYLNEATFNNKVSSENSSIAEKSPVVSQEETFEPVIITDESSGNSSVIPQDTTTYTYPANTVTDETTSEQDATHRQNERVPYTSTDTNEDTSNWSLWDFVKGIFGKIGNLISSIGNLVTDLISGLINLVIPTTQQWDNLKNDYSVLGDTIQSHLPFVSFIRTTFEDAQNTVVSPFDFLNITMPSFSFFGGNTEETNYVNVRDAYEPYRIQIRSWLVLIVYGVAFVYIVKHVSDYGATQYANSGLEALQSGNRLGRGKGD